MKIQKVVGGVEIICPYTKTLNLVSTTLNGTALTAADPSRFNDTYIWDTWSESTGFLTFAFPLLVDAVAAAYIASTVNGFGLLKSATLVSRHGATALVKAAINNDASFFKGTGVAAAGLAELNKGLTNAPWVSSLVDSSPTGGSSREILLQLGFSAAQIDKAMLKHGHDAPVSILLTGIS